MSWDTAFFLLIPLNVASEQALMWHWSAAVLGKVLEPQVIQCSDKYNADPLFFFFYFYICNATEFKIRRGAGSQLSLILANIWCFVTSTEIEMCFKPHFLQVQHRKPDFKKFSSWEQNLLSYQSLSCLDLLIAWVDVQWAKTRIYSGKVDCTIFFKWPFLLNVSGRVEQDLWAESLSVLKSSLQNQLQWKGRTSLFSPLIGRV